MFEKLFIAINKFSTIDVNETEIGGCQAFTTEAGARSVLEAGGRIVALSLGPRTRERLNNAGQGASVFVIKLVREYEGVDIAEDEGTPDNPGLYFGVYPWGYSRSEEASDKASSLTSMNEREASVVTLTLSTYVPAEQPVAETVEQPVAQPLEAASPAVPPVAEPAPVPAPVPVAPPTTVAAGVLKMVDLDKTSLSQLSKGVYILVV